MWKRSKDVIKAAAAGPAFIAYRLAPCRPLLHVLRKASNIQLSATELAAVCDSIRSRPRCRFLVFGLGNDSHFWSVINRGGQTIFLEDSPDWLRSVTARNPELQAREVRYTTRLGEWKELLDQPERLAMELPPDVREEDWDVVLVDAPAGWNESTPGRMQSVFMSRRLAAPGGDVFVHDCDREVERACCDRLLPAEGFVKQVGKLRHYRV